MRKNCMIAKSWISKLFMVILLLLVGTSSTLYAGDPPKEDEEPTEVPDWWDEIDDEMPLDPYDIIIRSVQPVVTYNFIITYLDDDGNVATVSTPVQSRLDVYRAYIKVSGVLSVEFILM